VHRGPERLALSRRFVVSLSIGVDFREHLTEAVIGCDISWP
jgi:hypothetical protein